MHRSSDSFGTRVRRALGLAALFLAVVAGLPVGLWSADAALEFTSPVREGGQLRLRWTGGAGPFQLEESGSPGGPWVARGGPTAEFSAVVPMEQGERYFRVAGAGGLSPEEASMRATLVAIDDFAATVPTADRAVWRSRILAFLKARSDINEAGESPDGLWAITNDGIPLAFWNNRNPDPPGGDAVPGVNGRSGSGTPGASPARLAATVGEGFTLATPRLGRLLRRHHYTTTEDTASLDSLKGTRNESLFFINTHGGLGPRPQFSEDGQPVRGPDGKIEYNLTYALWSGTAIDPRKTDFGYSHNEFVSELRAGRLALVLAVASYATGTGGLQSERREWRFGITDAWVRHYPRFPERQHTSVWLAACRSGSADAAALRSAFRSAFRSAGAEMVSSWTEAVTSTIDNQAGLGIAFGALDPTDGPVKYTYTPCDGPPFAMAIPPVPPGSLEDEQLLKTSTEETLPDGTDIAGVLPGKTFPLSPGGVLAAATMDSEPEASFTWSATAPESPPDPEAAR